MNGSGRFGARCFGLDWCSDLALDQFDPVTIVDEPGKETVLFCRSDRRSGLAAEKLAAERDEVVRHLDGGILAWVAEGQAVTDAGHKYERGHYHARVYDEGSDVATCLGGDIAITLIEL